MTKFKGEIVRIEVCPCMGLQDMNSFELTIRGYASKEESEQLVAAFNKFLKIETWEENITGIRIFSY